jgi:phage/plasmid-associated DNA primase
MITEKRVGSGQANEDIMAIKGRRYINYEEPSKGAVLNDGAFKELSGGGVISSRKNYGSRETFTPQATFVLLANVQLIVNTSEDGTWRRIKKVIFPAKFAKPNEKYTDTTPYVFPRDTKLYEKLKHYAPIFLSVLIKRAFETDGELLDCEYVEEATLRYREEQDYISAFIKIYIERSNEPNAVLSKADIATEFATWFRQSQPSRKFPGTDDLNAQITIRYGEPDPHGRWKGIRIVYQHIDPTVH